MKSVTPRPLPDERRIETQRLRFFKESPCYPEKASPRGGHRTKARGIYGKTKETLAATGGKLDVNSSRPRLSRAPKSPRFTSKSSSEGQAGDLQSVRDTSWEATRAGRAGAAPGSSVGPPPCGLRAPSLARGAVSPASPRPAYSLPPALRFLPRRQAGCRRPTGHLPFPPGWTPGPLRPRCSPRRTAAYPNRT